jgi:hypothetical protein
MIERIIFLQGDHANESLDIYKNQGIKALLEHLIQWHYMGEHEVSDEHSHGAYDRVFSMDGYLITVNTVLGHVGLEYKLN